jgi:EAL domain-containing protein (putative c-di-GMP-specific phosphodiesterase class I)
MSVNISARQFQHSDLVTYVSRILEETGLEPSALSLEITESLLMEDARSITVTLHQLKKLGVKLLIDDFGTGYSSLSYLKRLPIDSLKIDRSFVDEIGRRSGDLNVASVIVSLAHILGLGVIAEGVESENQLVRLRELGCDLAQGNYFSKPLSSEAASEFLASSMQG